MEKREIDVSGRVALVTVIFAFLIVFSVLTMILADIRNDYRKVHKAELRIVEEANGEKISAKLRELSPRQRRKLAEFLAGYSEGEHADADKLSEAITAVADGEID